MNITDLILDISLLRQKCPWYQNLTLEALSPYLIEESQETIGALADCDHNSLKDELGDVLQQIILFSQIANEHNWFSMQDVMDNLHTKIIRRNQHVFGALTLENLEAVNQNWQEVKINENQHRRRSNYMIDLNFQNNQAIVKVEGQSTVIVPLDPPPAQKITVGYTRLAWIWSAVNNALEAANIDIPFEETSILANRILEISSVVA